MEDKRHLRNGTTNSSILNSIPADRLYPNPEHESMQARREELRVAEQETNDVASQNELTLKSLVFSTLSYSPPF